MAGPSASGLGMAAGWASIGPEAAIGSWLLESCPYWYQGIVIWCEHMPFAEDTQPSMVVACGSFREG